MVICIPRPTNPVVGPFHRLPPPLPPLGRYLGNADVLTGDKITVVTIYAVIGDIFVDGGSRCAGLVVHVALRGPMELLGAVEARNVAPTVQVVQFGSCEVDRPPVARGVGVVVFIADDDGFWNRGKRGVFTMAAQPSHMVGDSQSR